MSYLLLYVLELNLKEEFILLRPASCLRLSCDMLSPFFLWKRRGWEAVEK